MSEKTSRKSSGQGLSQRMPFHLSPVAAVVTALVCVGGVHAQQAEEKPKEATEATEVQTLKAVTVRSRSKLAKLQDVPVAESVVSGADLGKELAQDLNSITKRVAGISFNQNNTRGASLSIRGLGKRGFTEQQDPSVLVTVDDISYGLTQLGNFDFFDIDQVSVARGPQGTAGGKGGAGGELKVVSRKPTFESTSDYSLTLGERDTLLGQAALGGSVIDDLLAWRGAFTVNKGQGFYRNSTNERNNYSMYNTDRIAGRVQFLLTPTTDTRALFIAEVEPRTTQLQNGLTENVESPLRYANGVLVDRAGTSARSIFTGFTDASGVYHGPREWFSGRGFNYSTDYLNSTSRTGTVNFNETQGQYVGYKGTSLKLDKEFGDLTLSSISGWRRYIFDARNDEGTPFDIAKLGGGGVYYQQLSQEFKLASAPGTPFEYQTGLYFLKTRNAIESHQNYGSDAGAWYATTTQYESLYKPADAVNRAAGRALLADSLQGLYTVADTNVKTQSNAIYGQLKWQQDPKLSWTTGARLTQEDRRAELVSSYRNGGAGSLLNPVATSRGYALGGFATTSAGELSASNTDAQRALANQLAQKYYGVDYGSLTADQKKQVAAAKAIRSARIGALITGVKSDYTALLGTANISPSYKFNDEVTGYFSWQYGEKSGAPIVVNGVAAQVKPERTQAFELGFKSNLLDKTLVLNANAFLMNIRDYQQTVRVVDEWGTANNTNGDNTTVYASVQGNVDLVRAKGVELDAVYSGVRNTTIRASATYNDARYIKFGNAPFPSELAYLSSNTNPYYDQSGKTLAGAPKVLINVGAEYRIPVFADKSFHASFNTAYTSRTNNDELLSDYSWIPAHSVTDVTVGIGQLKKNFDVSLTVKNVFDDKAHEQGWTGYEPTPYRRWVGITFSGSL